MPEDIMKRARASLSTQEIELSQLIANLHKRLEETERAQRALEQERAAMIAREKQIVEESRAGFDLSVGPLIRGRLLCLSSQEHVLVVTSPQPVADLPGVPTFRSLNYPQLEVQGWAALLAPKGTIPPEGLARCLSGFPSRRTQL